MSKDYKQEFSKEQGEHSTPVIVVVPPHQKRMNIDEIGKPVDLVEYVGSKYIVVDYAEDGTHLEIRLDQDVVDALVPREVNEEEMTITPDAAASTITFSMPDDVNYEHKHIHLMFEVEGSGVHYGGDVVVHPEDSSPCFSAGRLLVNGEFYDFSATINDGDVSIVIYELELGASDSVSIHYTVLLDE